MKRTTLLLPILLLLGIAFNSCQTPEPSGEQVQQRLDRVLAQGDPLVIHAVVALCDNEHQGIVPVPKQLGNGQDPRGNLYWGAMYGLRTYLTRQVDWSLVAEMEPDDERILERVVLHTQLPRKDEVVPVFLVADAWDGAQMAGAVATFFRFAAGQNGEKIQIDMNGESLLLQTGGHAQLTAFIGHNGLMDQPLQSLPKANRRAGARSSMVLACVSRLYFGKELLAVGSHPLLLTNGLMAPEAYTLDAAVRSWVAGGDRDAVLDAAARAYDTHQQCGLAGARNLFWGAM